MPRASLTHFILWASLAYFTLSYLLHSHGHLLNPLGFLGPITTSFAFGFIGFWTNPIYYFLALGSSSLFFSFFLFFSISYNSYGLITSSFGASFARFAFFEATYYLVGLWTIIPAILPQWSLLYCFPFSYCWASFAIGPFCQNGHQQTVYFHAFQMETRCQNGFQAEIMVQLCLFALK